MNYKMQSINNGVYQQTLFVTNLFTKFPHILNDVDKQDLLPLTSTSPHVSSADSSPYSCAATVSASSHILRAQVASTLADSSYIFASFNLISLILTSPKFSQQLLEVTVQRSSGQTCKTSIKISDPKLNMWNILNAVFYILSLLGISVLCSFHLSSLSSLVLLVLTREKNTSYCQMISTLQFTLQVWPWLVS